LHRSRLLAIPTAALVALSLAACGGDDNKSSDEDPAAVLQATFGNDQDIKSGTFDVSLNVTAEGDQGGSVDISLGGPFQSREDDIPAFDVEGSVKADTPVQDVDFDGGIVSTGQAAYVSYKDKDYQVPQEAFDTFAQRFLQLQQQSQEQAGKSSGNFLKALGIDPTTWLTNLENEGIEDVEGSDAIHISGDADVAKLVEDIQKIADNAGQAASQITPEQLSQFKDSVKKAHFDIYSGTDDDILRKFDGSVELEAPPGTPGAGATGKVTVDFSLTLGEINEDQEVTAPEGAEPFENLLQQFGLDASALQGILGGSALPQAGGSPAAPGAGATDAYLQCLQTAQGAAQTQACAELL